MSEVLYRTSDVCAVSKATFRQVDYWTREGFLHPVVMAAGSGSQREWHERSIVAARCLVIANILGTSRLVRQTIARHVECEPCLSEKVIVTTSGRLVEVLGDGDVTDGTAFDIGAASRFVDDGLASLVAS